MSALYIWDRAVLEQLLFEKYRHDLCDAEDHNNWMRHNFRRRFAVPIALGLGVFVAHFSGNKRLFVPVATLGVYLSNVSTHQCNLIIRKYVGIHAMAD